ncbi:Yip1 domain-containing protein [Cladochytrium replicatum]|nr:Yip1 domain-containing protein [Cladochytrium replicatum]
MARVPLPHEDPFADVVISIPSASAGAYNVSGNIGSNAASSSQQQHSSAQAGPAFSANLDTLDEPVMTTIMRDLKNIAAKMRQVLLPTGDKNILKDWDLWGPLLLCLTLSVRLSVTAPASQSSIWFTLVFAIVWCGAAVVTLNSKLLGGKLSFFQSLCVLGYCIFPLVLASLITLFIPSIIIRSVLVGVAFAWGSYASMGFLADVNLSKRRMLAVYPMVLFYFTIAWLVLISKSLLG